MTVNYCEATYKRESHRLRSVTKQHGGVINYFTIYLFIFSPLSFKICITQDQFLLYHNQSVDYPHNYYIIEGGPKNIYISKYFEQEL